MPHTLQEILRYMLDVSQTASLESYCKLNFTKDNQIYFKMLFSFVQRFVGAVSPPAVHSLISYIG